MIYFIIIILQEFLEKLSIEEKKIRKRNRRLNRVKKGTKNDSLFDSLLHSSSITDDVEGRDESEGGDGDDYMDDEKSPSTYKSESGNDEQEENIMINDDDEAAERQLLNSWGFNRGSPLRDDENIDGSQVLSINIDDYDINTASSNGKIKNNDNEILLDIPLQMHKLSVEDNNNDSMNIDSNMGGLHGNISIRPDSRAAFGRPDSRSNSRGNFETPANPVGLSGFRTAEDTGEEEDDYGKENFEVENF